MPDYRVYRGDILLGTLTETEPDMPWWEGEFEAAPGFEGLRTMFERERRLLDEGRMEEWEVAWRELAEGMRLEPLDGRGEITRFLLHISEDGRSASWRY